MGLLQDIQQELLDPRSDIGPTLLKLRYLASKLGSHVLEDWVKYETEGYPTDVEVPEYRQAALHYTGTFSDGYRTVSDAQVPRATILSVSNKTWLTHSIRDSIAVIDKFVASESDPAAGKMGLSVAELAPLLNNKVYEGMGTITLKATFSGAPFSHIHNIVRAKILDLTLELEKQVPVAKDIAVGAATADVDAEASGATAQITQYVVYGNQTNISNTATSGGSINVSVVAGDQTSLVDYLVNHGVPKKAADELATLAANEQPNDPEEPIGAKARGWLEKAVGGAWSVSKEVGTELLTEALKAYYGLNA